MAKQTTSERFAALAEDFTRKAAALQLAAQILGEEDRKNAVAAAPQKFAKAIARLNGDTRMHGEKRRDQVAAYIAAHPGASTRDIAEGLDVSGATVLKYIWEVARPVEKRPRGSKLPWNWIAKGSPTLQAPTKRTLQGRKGMQARSRAQRGRKTPEERREQVIGYLQKHPGALTMDIEAGLDWRKNQVLKFANMVARPEGQGSQTDPYRWYLGKKATTTAKRKWKKVSKPTAEWLADIKAYLSTHPEAFTVEIAKAVRRHPNSGFVKLVRQVAKPARATTATQPIPWVLMEA